MIKKKAVAGGIVALAAVLGGGGIFAWTRRHWRIIRNMYMPM